MATKIPFDRFVLTQMYLESRANFDIIGTKIVSNDLGKSRGFDRPWTGNHKISSESDLKYYKSVYDSAGVTMNLGVERKDDEPGSKQLVRYAYCDSFLELVLAQAEHLSRRYKKLTGGDVSPEEFILGVDASVIKASMKGYFTDPYYWAKFDKIWDSAIIKKLYPYYMIVPNMIESQVSGDVDDEGTDLIYLACSTTNLDTAELASLMSEVIQGGSYAISITTDLLVVACEQSQKPAVDLILQGYGVAYSQYQTEIYGSFNEKNDIKTEFEPIDPNYINGRFSSFNGDISIPYGVEEDSVLEEDISLAKVIFKRKYFSTRRPMNVSQYFFIS